MDFRSVLVTRSYQQVIDQIRDRIRNHTLVPGQRLPTERELSESFGVSRSVVREALKVLSSMGLVESLQGSGTYVRANPIPAISRALTLSATTEERSILGLFELRDPLDTAAARHASARRTDDKIATIRAGAEDTAAAAARDDVAAFGIADNNFHHAIYQAADNPYLPLVLGAVRDIQSDVMALVVRVSGSMTHAAGQHRRIAAAIAAGDPDGAATAMAEHVRYAADALLNVLALPAAERDEMVPQLGRVSFRA